MARTRKSIQSLNLYKYDVLIDDKGPRSEYFKISQFDGYFYGGRNAFLVAGAAVLQPGSKVLVEVLNKDGTTVYSAPMPSFIEGNSRLIQIEVYEDTPIGPGKIVILGCADRYVDGTPIPDNWKNKYNVRWITDVIISPRIENKTPIRFLRDPSVIVEEKFYNPPSSSLFSQSISIPIDVTFTPKKYTVFQNGYLMRIDGPLTDTRFFSKYEGGTITGSIKFIGSSGPETASIQIPITKIYNKTNALSEGVLVYTDKNTLFSEGFISSSGTYTTTLQPFGTVGVTSSLSLQYDEVITENTGSATSFAKIRLSDLRTTSGEIHKLRISYKSTTEPGEYILLGDVPTDTFELLAVDSASRIAETGRFNDVNINTYWYSATMSLSKDELTPVLPTYYYSSSLVAETQSTFLDQCCIDILNAITATPTVVSNEFIDGKSYFIGTRQSNPIELLPRTEYTLKFDAFVAKSSASIELIQDDYSLEVYLIRDESDTIKILDENVRGQLIGTLTPSSTFLRQNFGTVEFNFTPKINVVGNFGLRFVVYGGHWSIANVSVKSAKEPFFSSDEHDLLIPNVNFADKLLTYKIEYLDINNNSVGKSTISNPTYFTGSIDTSTGTSIATTVFPYSGSAVITGSLLISGSGLYVTGSTNLLGNLIVSGTLTATQFSTIIVSSSTLYSSGSTKFGDSSDDTHQFTGSISVLGNVLAPSLTGSLFGTSSFATSASYALTSSFALSSSIAISSSYAQNADTLDGLNSTVFATTGSNSFVGTQIITGSLIVSGASTLTNIGPAIFSGSLNITRGVTGSLFGTSSWALNSISASAATSITFTPISASYALSSSFTITASFATTASFAFSSSRAVTSSFAITSSYVLPNGLPSGIVSSSTFSSPSQGTVRAVINGVTTDVDTGLQTGDSPSFAGLTVDTNTLYVDATNNEVGIGTTTPGAILHVQGNVSASSYTSSLSNRVGFLGTASAAVTSSYSVTSSYALNAVTPDIYIAPTTSSVYYVSLSDLGKRLIVKTPNQPATGAINITTTSDIPTGSKIEIANYAERTIFTQYIDKSFRYIAGGKISHIVTQSDGKMVLAGDFTSVSGSTRTRLARISYSTIPSLDSLAQFANLAPNARPQKLAVQSDGKIVLVGTFTQVSSSPAITRNYAARVDSTGVLDSFNPNLNGAAYAVSIVNGATYNGGVWVGGAFTTVGGAAQAYLVLLNSDGTRNVSVTPSVSNTVYAIANSGISGDSQAILIGGNFTTVNSVTKTRLMRLGITGFSTAFPDVGVNGYIEEIIVQADGKILICGNFTSVSGSTRQRVARLNNDGTLDTTFGDPNINLVVYDMVLQQDNKIIITGDFTTVSGSERKSIARLNTDGSLDKEYDPGINFNDGYTISTTDGSVFITGSDVLLGANIYSALDFYPSYAFRITTSSLDRFIIPSASTYAYVNSMPRYSVITAEKILDTSLSGSPWLITQTNTTLI